jgi:hypothetical protein
LRRAPPAAGAPEGGVAVGVGGGKNESGWLRGALPLALSENSGADGAKGLSTAAAGTNDAEKAGVEPIDSDVVAPDGVHGIAADGAAVAKDAAGPGEKASGGIAPPKTLFEPATSADAEPAPSTAPSFGTVVDAAANETGAKKEDDDDDEEEEEEGKKEGKMGAGLDAAEAAEGVENKKAAAEFEDDEAGADDAAAAAAAGEASATAGTGNA